MDDTIIITRASRCLSIMNIHGARRAGSRKCKACMGWSWAAACGVHGRGHIVRPRAQLVSVMISFTFIFSITVIFAQIGVNA